MKEKNIERANAVCELLERYRERIRVIYNVVSIETKQIQVDVRVNSVSSRKNVIIELGDEYIKWSLNREKMRLQGRILELEAELSKL